MITIIADERNNQIGRVLFQELLSKGVDSEYISLEGVQVNPCLNCGGCTYKTYGECVSRDDGDWICPKAARSDVILFVTPIVFGSYSFKIKRVFDKFGLIMDRHYFMKNGELVKGGMIGKQFKFFAVGDRENCMDEEIEAFKKLFHENLLITRGLGKAYIVDAVLTSEMKTQIIQEVLSA
jgi:multimeric flavodoxin WrbA